MNVSSRRCNLRINAKEEKENSPERAEHSPMKGLFDPFRVAKNSNVNEFRRLHLRLLLWSPFGELKPSITSIPIPLLFHPKHRPETNNTTHRNQKMRKLLGTRKSGVKPPHSKVLELAASV
ncbi:MAG: hypothetical protein DRH70_03110 [Candidatus Coatesbacteria bacterium]|nr:MAG: hypothetical protein DRH70_03110 [Candidatus Coatesbacteria bacterium]